MASKRKRSLAKVIKGRTILERDYQIIGRLEGEPKVGDELVYVVKGKLCKTREVIKEITQKGIFDQFYPGRIIIETDQNTYISDDFITFSENSRRGSRL